MRKLTPNLFLFIILSLLNYSTKAQCNLNPIFKTTYTTTCPSTPVTFINQTDTNGKNIVAWYWDFGNGIYDSTMTNWTNFQHIYPKDGSFNPKLTLVDNTNCSESYTGVEAAKNIYYEFDIQSSVNGLPVCWDGNTICYSQIRRPLAYYWLWEFDDPSTGPNNFNDVDWTACHSYSSTGIYDVILDIWEPNCHRDTTYCEYAQLKGPKAMIKLPPPPAFPPNDCHEGEIIPLEVFNRYASWCLNPSRDSVFYATRQYIGPYLVSVERFYCNADTTTIDTVFNACNTFWNIARINYHMLTYDPSKTIYNYDSIQEITVGKSWTPPITSSAMNPVTPPTGLLYYRQSGTCTPQTMHDTDEFIPACKGPNYVRFTNNSYKFRLYYAIDDDPTSNTFPRDDLSQDICVNKSYPWASDSMQYFWDFGDPYASTCTSTINNPDMNCRYSTEVAPWHLYSQSGCYPAKLTVIDTINQCVSTETINIIMEEPNAGYDQSLLNSFNNTPGQLPVDSFDWETQMMAYQLAKQLGLNRGMILDGIPCVQSYPQRLDLSETLPSCGSQTYWMLFDSAIDCDTSACIDYTYMDLDADGIAEKHTHTVKLCNWIPQTILELFLSPYYYPSCNESPPPIGNGARCPCKTIGLIIQTGDCFDTFFYHDYKYIFNLDARFDILAWRDYSPPMSDSLFPLNYGYTDILIDKNNDSIPDYVVPNQEHLNLCQEHELILEAKNQWQRSVVEFTYEVRRSFGHPDSDPNFILEGNYTNIRDTIYRLCHKNYYTIDIFTGDTTFTKCLLFPDPSSNCGPQLFSNQTTLNDFYTNGYKIKGAYPILKLDDTLTLKDQYGRSIWEPGKYFITSELKSIPTDPNNPLFQCSSYYQREIHVGHYADFEVNNNVVCGNSVAVFSGTARYFKTWTPTEPLDTLSVSFWENPVGSRGGNNAGTWYQNESWDWDLDGDSIFETSSIPGSNKVSFVYSQPGKYTVRLRTTDSNGCVQVLEKKDYITVKSHSTVTVDLGNDTVLCNGSNISLDAGSGYSSYYWNTGSYNQQIYVASPGMYYVTVTDSSGCSSSDTINVYLQYINIDLGNDTSFCSEDTLIISADTGYSSYNWSTGDSTRIILFTFHGSGFSKLVLYVTNQYGCTASDSILIFNDSDCVWPGDANRDGVANNLDMLPIGIAFNSTGPERPNATIVWDGQPAFNWNGTLSNGVNYKNIDTDGDSTITFSDTLAVIANYNKTYSRLGNNGDRDTDPSITINLPDNLTPGQSVSAPIEFGTASLPVNNLYGTAFSIIYDNKIIDQNSIYIDFTNTWTGTPYSDLIAFYKVLAGNIDIALTRIDHQNIVSDYGTIGFINFKIKDDIWGYPTLKMEVEDVIAISNDEIEIPVFAGKDSVVIITGIPGTLDIEKHFNIYPVPAREKLNIEYHGLIINKLEIINNIGQIVYSNNEVSENKVTINVRTFEESVYILKIYSNKGILNKKVNLMK